MNNKVSVITVVYNDARHIRKTMESFFSQTCEDKEYVVIDGGSTDGTAEIIKEYGDRLHYWCSEKDNGIYDALNKGIMHCTGEWINILNCGDVYVNAHALEDVITLSKTSDADVIYGNSIEVRNGDEISIVADDHHSNLEFYPIYRHGSSLTRTEVQRRYMFDLNKSKKLGFALDWEMIHRMFTDGCKFEKVNCYIEKYKLEGASNHPVKSLWYNYRITSNGKRRLKKLTFFLKSLTRQLIANTLVYKYATAFICEYVVNDILPHIPFWNIRRGILKSIGMKIGRKSFLMKRSYIMSPRRIRIGDYTDINRGCFLDGRGGITIGNNVSVSHEVKIVTGSHDVNSKNFSARYLPITIGDNAWLGVGCTVLQGVTIGRGAVVCAGAVVTRDVAEYEIVGGIPARHIKNRSKDLDYKCIWDSPFT